MAKNPFLKASRHLAAIDADWARLVASVGPCTHAAMPEREPYEALARAVAHQQLHRRAAEAILARLEALQGGFPTPAALMALDEASLRACGFSLRKIATLKAIAEGALSGLVPSRALADQMDDELLIKQLVSLPGIGRWTVEMLLIYTLARGDVLPVDDYGVRAGYRWLKSLPELPKPRELHQASLACSPHRTVAAWYLWRAVELPDYKAQPPIIPKTETPKAITPKAATPKTVTPKTAPPTTEITGKGKTSASGRRLKDK